MPQVVRINGLTVEQAKEIADPCAKIMKVLGRKQIVIDGPGHTMMPSVVATLTQEDD